MTQDYQGVLFTACNPLLDISADVTLEMVQRYGAAFGNSILAEEKHMPVFEEMMKNYKVNLTAGGATQNVARVFQWNLNKGPNCATFVGAVGDDEYAKLLEQEARKDGVNVQYCHLKDYPTGTCACLVVGKERSLIANLAAANHYKFEHLMSEPIQELVKKAQFYYISGFFLTVSTQTIMHIAQHAAENNKIFSMNLSATFIPQFFKEPLLNAVPYMDYLFGNEEEARVFAKCMGWETEDVIEIAKRAVQLEKVNKNRPRTVIFTQGSDPVVVAEGQADGSVKVSTFPIIKIAKELIVDTNGAGDSFVGGFLSQLVQGKPLETCVKAGCYASSIVIQNSGAVWGSASPFQE